MTNINYQDFSF